MFDEYWLGSETNDNRWCNCLALHDFAGENVKWQEWFDFVLAIFTKHNLEPTRLGVSGEYYGNSPKTLTFKGGKRKLEKYKFSGITNLCFMAMENKDNYTDNFIINASLYPNWQNSKKSFLLFV